MVFRILRRQRSELFVLRNNLFEVKTDSIGIVLKLNAKDKVMKVVQVIPFFGMGGAEIMCESLVYELRKLGHEVVVVSLYNKKTPITTRIEKACAEIRYLDKKAGLDFSMFGKLKKLFEKEKPDVIHSHLYVSKYVFPVAAKMKIRVVHTIHNVAEKENGRLERKLNNFFFKHCHLIPVALSELIRDSIVKEYGINKDKIPVIYNGIDLSKCLPKTDYSIYGNFKILHIGRFSEQKNHVGLLKAFKSFHDNHSDSELWLIGDGEKKAEIERYVIENKLDDSVKFLGLQSNVYGYLHGADMFILPSHYEGIPMTLIEAMGTGLPIVATAVGGVPDMLDQSCAQLVSVDVLTIANAIENYYHDYNLRKTNGEKVLRMSKCFSSETMACKYLDVYHGEGLC